MATAGVVNSKLLRIYTGATPAALTCATNAELSFTNETRETTCKDSGTNKEFLYAQNSWTMSGEGLFAFDAANGGVDLFDIALAQTTVAVVYQTGVTGDDKWSGTALVTEWTLSSPGTNENCTYTFTLQGTGALVRALVS